MSRESQGRSVSRVAVDAQGRRTDLHEVEVGHDLGTIEWTPDQQTIDLQCRLDQDFDPWYSVGSPYGGTIAPPQLQYRPPRWLLSRNYNIRGLFYRWEMENVRPIRPGVTLRISGRVAETYERRGREFIVYEAEATDPEGDVVFRTRRTHVLDVLGGAAPREQTGIDSGIKQEKV